MLHRLFSILGSGEKTAGGNQADIEEDCNYCPQCGDAYRAEIKTCAACSVALISGSEKLAALSPDETASPPHDMSISADDELVTIQEGKLGQLKTTRHLLKAAFIPSIFAGDNTAKG